LHQFCGVPPYEIENLYIGGRRTAASDGGETELRSPANGQVIARVAEGTADDARSAVDAASRAMSGDWKRINSRDRGRILGRIAMTIREHAEELARIGAGEGGETPRGNGRAARRRPWASRFATLATK